MTDYDGFYDEDRPEDRSQKYGPPQTIQYPAVDGLLQYAEVLEDGELVGAIWMALNPATLPRAGIVLATIEGSDQFQTQLGMHSLNYSRDPEPDAVEWIEQVTAVYDGAGALSVGSEATVSDLETLRARFRE